MSSKVVLPNFSVNMASSSLPVSQQEKRIASSSLYMDIPPGKVPILYSSMYNIAFMGLEKLHPFDSSKWGRICNILVEKGALEQKTVIDPPEATKDDLLVVHTEEYLQSLKESFRVASIIEVPLVALLPNFIVQRKVLQPFRKQVGGTVLAGKLALQHGWAINLGGGFHHCCATRGGGFCAYADISLCIKFLFSKQEIGRVMIIDLDAHQGNGHEHDFGNDGRVYIFDMYNAGIYPLDLEAKKGINRRVELKSGTSTAEYLKILEQEIELAFKDCIPEILVYNAGTDILEGDPLGLLEVSAEGIKQRDEIVFRHAKSRNIPIVMLTSGGYMKSTASIIADSIMNLNSKGYVSLKLAG